VEVYTILKGFEETDQVTFLREGWEIGNRRSCFDMV